MLRWPSSLLLESGAHRFSAADLSVLSFVSTACAGGNLVPFLTDHWEGVDDPDFCLIRIARVEVEFLRPGETAATTFIV